MRGLTSQEAQKRFVEYGSNALPENPSEPLWQRFLHQFQSPLIYILLFALAVDLGLWLYEGAQGLPLEALAILAILILNATLGTLQEKRSEEALRRLKALAEPMAWVLRDGRFQHLPSREIVPGDVVRLEAGDRIPADGVLLEASGVLVDESLLTGESVPVEKRVGDEVFSGTLLVRGRALMEVSRTGLRSAMGRIAGLLSEMEEEKTPLERRLEAFGHRVARWVLVLAAALVVLGFLVEGLSGKVLLFAVALAVAAVPEGLPAVLTLALALDRNPGVLNRPPRPKDSPLLDPPSLRFVLFTGTLKAAFALAVLGLLPRWGGYGLTLPEAAEVARAATFHFMTLSQLFFAYAARHTHLIPLPNPYLHGAVALGILIQILLGTLAPGVLEAVPVPVWVWGLVLALALLAWLMAEGVDRLIWRKEARR